MKTITNDSTPKEVLAEIAIALGLDANASVVKIVEGVDRATGNHPDLRRFPRLAEIYEAKKAAGLNNKDALAVARREHERQLLA